MTGRRPRQRSGPRYRRALVVALAASLLAVVALTLLAARTTPTPARATPPKGHAGPSTARHPPVAPAPPPPPPVLGVYAGPGNAQAAAAFASSTALKVGYAFDYLGDGSWQQIADPSWFLAAWSGTPLQMIWGVPMLPASGGSLAAGALGAYDGYFTQLAENLVAAGQGSSVLEVGWDPTTPGSPWSVTDAQEARWYVAYWDRIVAAMDAVPGASFSFCWDVASTPGPVPLSAVYPGDAQVSVVATDAFHVGAGSWAAQAAAPRGPDAVAALAAAHRKALALAKWGLVPGAGPDRGDDPAWVRSLLAWCGEHRVAFAVAWNDGAWGLTGGSFPQAAAVLGGAAPPAT